MVNHISEREVIVYREIYYETVKPMILNGKTPEEIEAGIAYVCEEFEISPKRWKILHQVDLLQRLALLNNPRLRLQGVESLKGALSLPTMRCPRRSEQL
jgi:hypothetical protein